MITDSIQLYTIQDQDDTTVLARDGSRQVIVNKESNISEPLLRGGLTGYVSRDCQLFPITLQSVVIGARWLCKGTIDGRSVTLKGIVKQGTLAAVFQLDGHLYDLVGIIANEQLKGQWRGQD